MESRVSVYGIAVGVWHHRRCISCGLIPRRLATDSIQHFVLVPCTPFGVIVAHEFKSIRKLLKISFLSPLHKEKSAFVRMRIFLCIIHYSLFIIHCSFVPHADF